MKKYTFNELVSEVTELKQDDWKWDSEYDLFRRIKKTLDITLGKQEITHENKNKYITLYKSIYNNQQLRRSFNKNSKKIENIEFEENIINIPYIKKELNNKEVNLIKSALLEFFKDDSKGDFLKKHMLEENIEKIEKYNKFLQKEEESYKEILDEFEVELEKMKLSTIPNHLKIEIFNELKEVLRENRLKYDNTTNIKFAIPKQK